MRQILGRIMRLSRRCLNRAVGLTVLLASTPGLAAGEGRLPELVACMEANLPTGPRTMELELDTERDGQHHRLSLSLLSDSDTVRRLILRVTGPEDLAGTTWLFERGPDGVVGHVWLPALERVRRVVGGERARLLDTTLSVDELEQLLYGFDGGSVSLASPGRRQGREIERMTVMPKPDRVAEQGRLRVEVDRETCMVLQAERVVAGRTTTRLSVEPSALVRREGRWTLERLKVEDVATGAVTRVEVLSHGPATPAPERFSPQRFYR